MTDTFELRFDFPVLSHFDTYETDIEGVSFPPDVCWPRVPLIVTDILLLYLTWSKLGSRNILWDVRQSQGLSLSDVLFYHGMSIYTTSKRLRVILC